MNDLPDEKLYVIRYDYITHVVIAVVLARDAIHAGEKAFTSRGSTDSWRVYEFDKRLTNGDVVRIADVNCDIARMEFGP